MAVNLRECYLCLKGSFLNGVLRGVTTRRKDATLFIILRGLKRIRSSNGLPSHSINISHTAKLMTFSGSVSCKHLAILDTQEEPRGKLWHPLDTRPFNFVLSRGHVYLPYRAINGK